ncbi:MAG: hemolysin III family protein [Terracidiphilus sp.]
MNPNTRLGDILANAITHGIGAGLAIAGAACLIVASMRGTATVVVSCAIFSGSLVFVYLCSTLYHSLVRTRARHVFHVLDHSAIYVLIAGTYTPFALVSLRGALGWFVFAAEWSLALAGILFKTLAMERLKERRFAVLSTAVYLFQGWFIVFVGGALLHAIGWHGMLWLAAGGAAYTLGVIFFAFDRLPYFHAAWHIFVLAGSIAHYFAILLYVVPAAA